MKLVVQIPCLNEERTLPTVVQSIPRRVPGIDRVEVLVVDDGSTDGTEAVARRCGVDHVVRHAKNNGLARAFRTGIDHAVQLGADLIVNLDGDNQYNSADIPRLVEPILAGRADIVVGDRNVAHVAHFSWLKRKLHAIGTVTVRVLSGLHVPDPVSGFRALSRNAAIRLNIVSPFSYTIEMLIQAGYKGIAVESVPIRTNGPTRPSRLFRSIPDFIIQSQSTMARMYAMYRPFRTFAILGLIAIAAGVIPIARFLWYFAQGGGAGHIQSLVLGAALTVIGTVTLLMGLLADLIGRNRQLIEIVLERTRRLELELADRNADRTREPNANVTGTARESSPDAGAPPLAPQDALVHSNHQP